MADTRDPDGPDPEVAPDRDAETAKLELPSFPGFGRKRRGKRTETAAEPPRQETRSQDYTEPVMTGDRTSQVDAVLEPAVVAPAVVETAVAEPAVAEPAVAEPAVAGPAGADEQAPPSKKPFTLPNIDGRIAAAITGALIGLLGGALTYLALLGCDAIRGTRTCGGGPGFFAILAILAVMVVAGALVLTLWRLPEPRATSVLGVGVLFVLMLLVLQDQLLSPWMFLVVPVVTALGFLLGHWVTTAFVEKVPEKGPQHDVR